MDVTVFIKQLTDCLAEYDALVRQSKFDDLSDLSVSERQAVVSKMSVAIRRATVLGSSYSDELDAVLRREPQLFAHSAPVAGVARALLDDIKAGFTKSLVELVHADLFGNFLEMAEHLLSSGYKDAAAVIAGATIEAHLRALCAAFKIDTNVALPDGSKQFKKADQLNSDLAKNLVYTKLDQKNVTAWLDLRNKAAHGEYGLYTHGQVQLMCMSVQDFMARHPA